MKASNSQADLLTIAASEHLNENSRNYRVLHVLDLSLPVLGGYTIRSRGLVNGQRALGFDPTVITGPLQGLSNSDEAEIRIDGTRYLRTPIQGLIAAPAIRRGWPVLREGAVIRLLTARLRAILRKERFDLVHAHSPVLCGLAGLRAARSCSLPFVYEIRAFWEDAAVDQKKTTTGSPRYVLTRRLEQHVVEHADAVVGIATSILDDLETRGISRDKLFHVPNGVDTSLFQPLPRNTELAAQLGIGDSPVLGFVGSLFYFEGVSWLVRAAIELHRRGINFKFLIAGRGEDAEAIRTAIRASGAEDYIFFVGQVPHEIVQQYYSLVDVMVYPRRSIRLTELVTPLKPLEAMAQGKAVLGSAVGGIRELVENEHTGLLFRPEDVEDFCRQASRLLVDGPLRERIAKDGRRMVLEHKDWKQIASRYRKVYDSALARRW